MAQPRMVVGLRRHGGVLGMLCGFATVAWSASVAADPLPGGAYRVDRVDRAARADVLQAAIAQSVHDFDIPAQPLGDALSQFGIASNQPAVFMSDLLNGRTSSAVRGRYTPEAALRLLLDGTGLTIEKITSSLGDSFLLKEAAQVQEAPGAPTLARFFGSGNYAGLIQERILSALCADARTAPGGYRALFQFQLNAGGRIQDASLLSSTDNRERDAALLAVLRGVRIEEPLPPALTQQALTMRLRPGNPQAASPCRLEGAL